MSIPAVRDALPTELMHRSIVAGHVAHSLSQHAVPAPIPAQTAPVPEQASHRLFKVHRLVWGLGLQYVFLDDATASLQKTMKN